MPVHEKDPAGDPPTRLYTRDVPLTALVIDPRFADLFPLDKHVIAQITASMRGHGFIPTHPIDVWKHHPSRGRHTVLDGHQRLTAAKKVGLSEVHVAYHEFADYNAALLFAALQQGIRRNLTREQQTLSVLRSMWRNDEKFPTTRALVADFKFAAPTIDRAKQLLQQGTESEIEAVLEGTHGLRKGYELMLKRVNKRPDQPPGKKRPPVLTALREALGKAIAGGLIELPEMVRHATVLYHWLEGEAPNLAAENDDDEDEERDADPR